MANKKSAQKPSQPQEFKMFIYVIIVTFIGICVFWFLSETHDIFRMYDAAYGNLKNSDNTLDSMFPNPSEFLEAYRKITPIKSPN